MTKEEFMALAGAKYAEINALKEQPTLLDYEIGFQQLWMEFGREVIQTGIGEQGKDRRVKKKSNAPSAKSK